MLAHDGGFYAFDNICIHSQRELSKGVVLNGGSSAPATSGRSTLGTGWEAVKQECQPTYRRARRRRRRRRSTRRAADCAEPRQQRRQRERTAVTPMVMPPRGRWVSVTSTDAHAAVVKISPAISAASASANTARSRKPHR